MKFSELKPNEKNPRKASEKKIEMLKKSLERFGSLDGIIYNRLLGRMVGGHQRQKVDENALICKTVEYETPDHQGTVALGYAIVGNTKIPYREVEWDEGTDEAANVAANKGAGEWDLPALKEMILHLDELNVDLDLTMFSEEERENLIVPVERIPPVGDADHVPATPKEPISKRGDLWKLGDHFVLCGDSLQVDDVGKLMGDEKADACFTDPPYGISYKGGSKVRDAIENDELTGETLREFLQTALSNAWAHMHPGGAIYVSHAETERLAFTQAFVDAGFKLSSCLIWVKNNSTFGRQDYFWKHEPILYGWHHGGAHHWYGPNNEDTVWAIDRPSRSDDHPTMKPVALVERALRNSTKPGDVVIDLFGGSGTTLLACEKITRRARLMELSPAYVDVIVRRWEEYTGQKAELVTQ